ncbi:sigma-70 family RNA polymerase sigma factor [Actinoplanes sp. NPDC051633]|uniref:RNA polymerase sigma factor n=1 Tax=Actinoplanes sp. NPDC051633 TaxID=3155670 RepID=UPI00341B90D6
MAEMADWDLPALVKASIDRDDEAWNELVRRFAGLVAFVIRHYRLSAADTQDVSQLVWLRLVEHLGQIREPAALAGWLATTTRHECERHLRVNGRSVAVDPSLMRQDSSAAPEIDEMLLATERRQVLLDGLAQLQPQQRELLLMLSADPPYAYAEISRLLGIPIGSIGPTRSRVLGKLRETDAVRAYLGAGRNTQMGRCP